MVAAVESGDLFKLKECVNARVLNVLHSAEELPTSGRWVLPDVGLRLWTCLCCCGFHQFWEPDTFRILEENEMSRTILRLIFFGFRPSYLDADKVAKSADWSGTPRMLWFLSALYPTAVITQESKWRPQPKLSLFLGNEVWPHFNLGDYCMCVTAKKNTDSKENILHRIIWIHVS